jgi:hypothetical protein
MSDDCYTECDSEDYFMSCLNKEDEEDDITDFFTSLDLTNTVDPKCYKGNLEIESVNMEKEGDIIRYEDKEGNCYIN